MTPEIRAIALAAAMASPVSRVAAQPPDLPNYSYDLIFEIRPGAQAQFDAYWARLREVSARGASGPTRHVDGSVDGARRVVRLPVARLAEYGHERRNEESLRLLLGDVEGTNLVTAFNNAQVERASYIRQYRNDLSVNRDRHEHPMATEMTLVTVARHQEAAFEKLWGRAAEAYRRLGGQTAIAVARTIVGGGPQFVLTRPARPGESERPLDPTEAVRLAFGDRAGAELAAEWKSVVVGWDVEAWVNLGLDTPGPVGGRP